MQDDQRKGVRTRREQLLTLLNGWDPAGLLEAGSPRDEYEFIVDPLLGLLSRNGSKEEVAAFLEGEMRAHFGSAAAPDASQFAAMIVAWFEIVLQ